MSELTAKLILAGLLAGVILAAAIVLYRSSPEPETGTACAESCPAPSEVSQLIEEARRITREATQ